MAENPDADTCVDCRQHAADLDIRNRRLCAACFIRYVTSKVLKRMESYRFKALDETPTRRLLLPLSGGISSVALLQILDAQLQRQISNRNRTAYELVIARVALAEDAGAESMIASYDHVAHRFPSHTFLPLFDFHAILSMDASIERDLAILGLERDRGEDDAPFFSRCLSSTASATTRADLQSILLRRLLVSIARAHGCESILWGHSDSRLAALTLAEVAKGRGGSVPSTIADGPSPFGINFNYPLRDLFKSEIQLYGSVLPEALEETAEEKESSTPAPTSIRHTAIDDLLSGYINTQAAKYPGIMANVVRTAGKLDSTHGTIRCRFCAPPILPGDMPQPSNLILCRGCERMKQDIQSGMR